jgi:hypothetical protein
MFFLITYIYMCVSSELYIYIYIYMYIYIYDIILYQITLYHVVHTHRSHLHVKKTNRSLEGISIGKEGNKVCWKERVFQLRVTLTRADQS